MQQSVEVLHTITVIASVAAHLAQFVLPLLILARKVFRKFGAFPQVSFIRLLFLIWLEAPLVDNSDLELFLVRNLRARVELVRGWFLDDLCTVQLVEKSVTAWASLGAAFLYV